MAKKPDEKLVKKNRDDVRRALEILFATDYLDKKKLYLENFIRGIVFAVGGVIGATLLIALLAWLLSIFDTLPLVGPLLDNTRETIQQGQGSR